MQTDKKNALSYDSPNYIIRQSKLLLQKDGNKFFRTENKPAHPPSMHKIKLIQPQLKFGISKDSPFHNKYTQINPLTPQLFKSIPPINLAASLDFPLLAYKKGKVKDNLFMKMLSCSTPKEELIRHSFVFKENMNNILSNTVKCLNSPQNSNFKDSLTRYKCSFSSNSLLNKLIQEEYTYYKEAY